MTIFSLRTFKTQIMTITRALVYHRLCGSVVERIKHTAFNISTYRERGSNPVRSRFSVSLWSDVSYALEESPHRKTLELLSQSARLCDLTDNTRCF